MFGKVGPVHTNRGGREDIMMGNLAVKNKVVSFTPSDLGQPPTVMRSLLAFPFFAIALMLAPLSQAQSSDELPDVTVGVDGLACPFCAYGIEKKMLEIEGVAEVAIQLDAGTVELWLNAGAAVTENRIREAVDQAGFEVRDIRWAAPQ